MLKYIEENGKYVELTGFKNVKIADAEKFLEKIRKEKQPNIETQFFDARLVATWQHLYFAVLNALTAFKNRENISKSLEVEIMLYASAQRQIQKAIRLLGIHHDSSDIAVVIVGEEPERLRTALSTIARHINAHPDETALELTREKMGVIQKAFKISDEELETVRKKDGLEEALTSLVIERVALLTTRR